MLKRVPGLPDRPLPGQGDRPEHAGVPVRERHVRADLEPQLHRLRADHGGRGPGHRPARRVLRHVGRAARPGAEPHAAAADAALHGAARDVRRRRRARREGQGAPRRSRRPSEDEAVRARYTAGMAEGKEARRLPRRGGRARRTRRPRPTSALRLEVDNWRWAGVPIYLRTGKRLARKVTEIAVTLKPVPHLAFEPQGSVGVQPNQLMLTMQPNEGVSLSLGAKIPGSADAHPAGEHGVPLRHGVPVAVAGGLRAADHGRHARRRRRCSPATTRWRRSGGSSTRSSSRGRRASSRSRSTRPARRARRRPTSMLEPGHRWRAI